MYKKEEITYIFAICFFALSLFILTQVKVAIS